MPPMTGCELAEWQRLDHSFITDDPPPPPSLRNTPIKRNDGDTFLRADLQHALLMEIFGDTTRCFRNPRPSPAGQRTVAPKPGESAPTGVHEYTPVYPYGQSKGSARRSNETPDEYQQWQERYQAYHDNPYPTEQQDPDNKVPRPGSPLLTFKELYIEALLNSPRCTKAVRDKVWQDEEFAENFACVNLLINIGRMNTTLACEWACQWSHSKHSHPLTTCFPHAQSTHKCRPYCAPTTLCPPFKATTTHAGTCKTHHA